MEYDQPHRELESEGDEVGVVRTALECLRRAGILSHGDYDGTRMLAHRRAVRESFDIPWTAISPRMQRLLYAINAVHQPRVMVAAGVFCGNTFISNAGAAVGPGACYAAEQLTGVEIRPEEAERAERNVRSIDATGLARVVAADAVDFVKELDGSIDLLYLDADGDGKRVYLDILERAYDKLTDGALVLAHNSENAAGRLAEYLRSVRDGRRFRASVNVVLDPEGLEVSRK